MGLACYGWYGDDTRCREVANGGWNAQPWIPCEVYAGAGTEISMGRIWRQLQAVAHRAWAEALQQPGATAVVCGSVLWASMQRTRMKALELVKISAEVTHNHPEGSKGVQAIAAAVFLMRQGKTKEEPPWISWGNIRLWRSSYHRWDTTRLHLRCVVYG